MYTADVECADFRSRSPFPAAWGTPPRGVDERAVWAAGHIRRAGGGRRPMRGAEALTELHERRGMRGDEALSQLRRRFVDPSLVRRAVSVDDALRQLDRRAARFATMARLVAES